MRHLLGIDVGGTFTDFVAYDGAERRIAVWKELSVPADPVVGILRGLERYPTEPMSRTSAWAPRSRPMPCSSARVPSSPT